MTVALALLALVSGEPSQSSIGAGIAVFGFGFGMVGQVLIAAVQNGVNRRQLGVAMAATSFFRGLGGALGAALLGAVFAARVGTAAGSGALGGLRTLSHTGRTDVIHAVQTVFIVAAPIAALALLVVLLLKEVPLSGSDASPAGGGSPHARPELSARRVEVQATAGAGNSPRHRRSIDRTFAQRAMGSKRDTAGG